MHFQVKKKFSNSYFRNDSFCRNRSFCHSSHDLNESEIDDKKMPPIIIFISSSIGKMLETKIAKI